MAMTIPDTCIHQYKRPFKIMNILQWYRQLQDRRPTGVTGTKSNDTVKMVIT
jgi:hypothetical protein